jgi:nitroimidazol reductase NimA-like FMN-containing flavoprotein (pyridoxamine 5'-phosphate oxidase superfamily)
LVRSIPAMSPAGSMNQLEITEFLIKARIPLELGTVDHHGDPMIHPLWYYYENGRFYLLTARNSRKLQSIQRQKRVYFCVDIDTRPYKGVKGKGTLAVVNDSEKSVQIGEKLLTKYLDTLEDPLGKSLMNRLRTGLETLLEITPIYFSVWDDSKSA